MNNPPTKYTIAKEFTDGLLASLKPQFRDTSKSPHWLAGWDSGYELRKEKNRRLNEYLVNIGEKPMTVVRTAWVDSIGMVNQGSSPARKEEFDALYCGEFSPHDAELYRIASEYHDACERYDEIVCTGPSTGRELAINIYRNAKAELMKAIEKGERLGLTACEVEEAIRKHAKHR